MDCLDLCISCGSHVADGSAYCSTRCMSLDAPAAGPSSIPRRSRGAFSSAYASSSTHPHSQSRGTLPPYASSICSDEDPFAAYTVAEPPVQHSCAKRASIESWARGVWGNSGDNSSVAGASNNKSQRRSSSPISMTSSSSPSNKKSSPSARASLPPRFPLTAAHLAPPTMGTGFTSSWSSSSDDSASSSASSAIHTPSSSHRNKAGVVVDPWIASPPFEFAYNFVGSKTQQQLPHRGRPLIRV